MFVRVELGKDNGYAVTEKGEAWVWGNNANGELGLSDYEPRVSPFPLVTMQHQRIVKIVPG